MVMTMMLNIDDYNDDEYDDGDGVMDRDGDMNDD